MGARKNKKEAIDDNTGVKADGSASADVTDLPAKKRQRKSDVPKEEKCEVADKDAEMQAAPAGSASQSKVITSAKAKAKGKAKGKGRKEAIVMKDAEAAGMTSGLKNLAARPEVASLGLSLDDLLSTLKACDGLVNK